MLAAFVIGVIFTLWIIPDGKLSPGDVNNIGNLVMAACIASVVVEFVADVI
jgi:hypothetical protein